MSCCCGHGPWHHQGCHAPPQYQPPPYPQSGYYPPEEFYEQPARRHRRRHGRDPEELGDHLEDLQVEIDRVRQELAAMREPDDESSGGRR